MLVLIVEQSERLADNGAVPSGCISGLALASSDLDFRHEDATAERPIGPGRTRWRWHFSGIAGMPPIGRVAILHRNAERTPGHEISLLLRPFSGLICAHQLAISCNRSRAI